MGSNRAGQLCGNKMKRDFQWRIRKLRCFEMSDFDAKGLLVIGLIWNCQMLLVEIDTTPSLPYFCLVNFAV